MTATPTPNATDVEEGIRRILKPFDPQFPRPRVFTVSETEATEAAADQPAESGTQAAEEALQRAEPQPAELPPNGPATVTEWLQRLDRSLAVIYAKLEAVESKLETKLDDVHRTLR
jgi:hypothetical protein